MRAEKKYPGLREQSQGHKNKITAISLAKTGGKVNGKFEPIEAQEKSAAGEEDPLRHYWSKKQTDTPKAQKIHRKRRLTSS